MARELGTGIGRGGAGGGGVGGTTLYSERGYLHRALSNEVPGSLYCKRIKNNIPACSDWYVDIRKKRSKFHFLA